jgi:hypothetical protein
LFSVWYSADCFYRKHLKGQVYQETRKEVFEGWRERPIAEKLGQQELGFV